MHFLKNFVSGLLLFVFFSFPNSLFAININKVVAGKIDVSGHLSWAEDKNSEWQVENIEKNNVQWEDLEGHIISFGASTSTIWAKVELNNQANDVYILFDDPIIDKIEVYFIDKTGNIIKHSKSGAEFRFNEREVNVTSYLFKLPKGDYTCYAKFNNKLNIQVPIAIGTFQSFMEEQHIRDMALALYLGLMLIMIFYNFFIYLSVKDKTYLYYMLYIFFVTLFYASLKGVTFEYLWSETPYLNYLIPAFSSTTSIFSGLFAISLLQTKTFLPKLTKGLNVFLWSFLVCVVLNILGQYDISAKISQLLTLIYSIYLIVVGVYSHKKGVKTAKFFLFAWTLFLLSVIIFILKMNSVIDYNAFTHNSVLFGSAIEAVLLSFALADRINILRKDKEDSQAEALRLAQENEKIVREQNIVLEQKVEERTKKLKEAQAQVVQNEKMASLGQLTAGVAHEINNPVAFIKGSLSPLKRDVDEIIEVVRKFLSIKEGDNYENKIQEAKELAEELDIEYSVDEVQELVESIEEGAVRTQEIVNSLKTFSRHDEASFKLVNLNDGMQSTLQILKSKMAHINIELNLGEISDIECYGGKLNQVFMNLLTNAIDAIDMAKKEEKGVIKVNTSQTNEHIVISISDNGIGMSEETQKKLFDPFYTTKDVGKGTGLGMSIVLGIIEQHKGTVNVESEPGIGTTFELNLPIHRN